MVDERMHEEIDNAPGASRVAESLRDTGYDFNVAIADIIDNSVDANADQIDVTVAFDLNYDLIVSIADSGIGMDREGLINALKYGADEQNPTDRLGKFGLGLKTASTAFARRLELISRSTPHGPVLAAIWDLDKVAETNKWTVQITHPSQEDVDDLDALVGAGTGTIVRWKKIDRLLFNYAEKSGQPRKKGLLALERTLREHLGLVFQRFLDPSFGVRQLKLSLNGSDVNPIDPFCTGLIEAYDDKTIEVEKSDGTTHSIRVRSFVLPRTEEFPNEEAAKAARVNNETQGVYVYRENRLIHGPDWLSIYKMEPHYNLARVELNFDHELDDAFQVDIKKSRIILDSELNDYLKREFFNPVRNLADERRRKGQKPPEGTNIHKPANTTIGTKLPGLTVPQVTDANEDHQEANVNNNGGLQKLPLRVVLGDRTVEAFIDTANSLQDGVLWQPSVINGSPGVTLNTTHDYYQKAYLPNKENSTVIQSLDYMLWAIAQAELNNINPDNREAFEEFRIEVSRNLRKLVANLPEAKIDSE
jgi:hypothetical protein